MSITFKNQKKTEKLLIELIELLTAYEDNSSLTDEYALETFVKIARKAKDLKNETRLR